MIMTIKKLKNRFSFKNLLDKFLRRPTAPSNLENLLDQFLRGFTAPSNDDFEKLVYKIAIRSEEDAAIKSEADAKIFLRYFKEVCKLRLNNNSNSIEPLLVMIIRSDQPFDFSSAEIIVSILIDSYTHLSDKECEKVLVITSIFSFSHDIAMKFFVAKLKDNIAKDVNSYHVFYNFYEAIKLLCEYTPEDIKKFLALIGDVEFDFTMLNSIALVEVFSSWLLDKKIEHHPLENQLDKVKEFISNEKSEFSYIVSLVAALLLIINDETTDILRRASSHRSLDVRMEAVYCRIYRNDPGALADYKELLLDPRISWQANEYLKDLQKDFNMQFAELDEIANQLAYDKDFIAQRELCFWLAHPRECGHPPDAISILGKMEYTPDGEEKNYTIYFIDYKYNEDLQIINGTGYALVENVNNAPPCVVNAFASNAQYTSVEEAFMGYEDDIMNWI